MARTIEDRAGLLREAVAQLQALKDVPGLELGLPCPTARLGSMLEQIETRRRAVESARLSWIGEARRLKEDLFTLRDALRANRAAATMHHGAESDAAIRLGARLPKPRKWKRKDAPESSGAGPQQPA